MSYVLMVSYLTCPATVWKLPGYVLNAAAAIQKQRYFFATFD